MSSSSSDPPVRMTQGPAKGVALLHIFKYLEVSHLLECRLVNQQWHASASEALYSRQLYIGPRKLLALSEDEELSFDDAYQKYSSNLKFLTDRICNNANFRFLGLIITGQMLREQWAEDYEEFAKSCGKHFRRLRLIDTVDTRKLPQVFATFSDIEHLSVGFLCKTAAPAPTEKVTRRFLRFNGQDIRLPKLECLTIVSSSSYNLVDETCDTWQVCKELIEASPALKRIEGFDVSLTEAAVKAGKLNTVTDLELRFPRVLSLHLSHLKTFSENCPPLESLAFSGFLHWVQRDLADHIQGDEEKKKFLDATWGSLNRILLASQDTLEYLFMDYLEKPVKLNKLRTLHLMDRNKLELHGDGEPYRIFSRDWEYSPSSYFPALRTVRLELGNCKGDSVRTFFGDFQDDKFPTVTALELASPFDRVGVTALASIFQNVKTLRVFWDKCNESCLGDLWSFSTELKVLEIVNFPVDSQEFEEFDASITGFYVDICENLRKRNKIPYDPGYLDAFRTNTSIMKLRGLEKFAVYFICKDPEEAVVLDSGVAPISHWYAFDLMPNLKTQFVYDLRGEHADVVAKALKPYKY